jgi:hypothetical protein
MQLPNKHHHLYAHASETTVKTLDINELSKFKKKTHIVVHSLPLLMWNKSYYSPRSFRSTSVVGAML